RRHTRSYGDWSSDVCSSDLTYRARLAGWYLTGDLGYRDEEGNYYHVDRDPDAVVGNGFYTALSEERILAACPEVFDCTVVIAREDGRIVTDVLLELTSEADQDT